MTENPRATEMMSFRLEPELKKQLDDYCKAQGDYNMTDVIKAGIRLSIESKMKYHDSKIVGCSVLGQFEYVPEPIAKRVQRVVDAEDGLKQGRK